MRRRATQAHESIASLRRRGAIPVDAPAWCTALAWSRFSRHAAGLPMKAIAAEDGVSPEAIRQAVNGVCRRLARPRRDT